MRLLTWNINGVRTLPLYHPWNTLKTGENIINELGADIVCFQEMKSSRQALEKSFALPGPYDAFFSFPTIKSGYSGVGVFTKSSSAVPLKAEEGLSGRLQSGLKPPLTQEERISSSYPSAYEMELVDDEAEKTHNDLLELDKEGRALILDFGIFVLINLYCPNETSDVRLPYKMNFHLLLAERVRRLVEIDKREVIVTGDINICATPIDHCDGELASNKEEFWNHPARKWFHEWLAPQGPMVDVVRRCWPERKGMFTCWNQKIDARVTNYGTRIDYFLLTKGLLPWFKHGDIMPSIKGSDHCPVYIDLHDEVISESGEKLILKNLMLMNGEKRGPPRLSSRYWSEYSGKQKLLSSFFGNKGTAPTVKSTDSPPPQLIPSHVDIGSNSQIWSPVEPFKASSSETEAQEKHYSIEDQNKTTSNASPTVQNLLEQPPPSTSVSSDITPSSLKPAVVGSPSKSISLPLATLGPTKRKEMQADSNYPAQSNKKNKEGNAASETRDDTLPKRTFSVSPPDDEPIDVDEFIDDLDDVAPSSSQLSLSVPGSSQNGIGKNAQQWSTLFARIEPPKCVVHGEPTREFTVNKPGLNKGKAFFICSRPVGPGYDAGRDKRLREEVDPHYRCNFFKWSSEVKKAALREAGKRKEG